jgi:CHAD domain-containing protein
MVQVLRSERYRTLMERWARFVEGLGRSPDDVWRRPVPDLAAPQIRKMNKRLLREGDALEEGSEDAEYHELRKTCKKLRYLMELFRDSFDEAAVGRAIKRLKKLQDELGRFQDCSTQVETFRRLGEQMQASGEHSAATMMALGVLVQKLEEAKHTHMRGFRRRFRSFPRGAARDAVAPRRGEGAAAIEGSGQL